MRYGIRTACRRTYSACTCAWAGTWCRDLGVGFGPRSVGAFGGRGVRVHWGRNESTAMSTLVLVLMLMVMELWLVMGVVSSATMLVVMIVVAVEVIALVPMVMMIIRR